MPSDGFDIHVRYVKKTKACKNKTGLQWGWNGNVMPTTNFDEQERDFLKVLRDKFPDGFIITRFDPATAESDNPLLGVIKKLK